MEEKGEGDGAKIMRSVNLLLQVAVVIFKVQLTSFPLLDQRWDLQGPQDKGVNGLFSQNPREQNTCALLDDAQIFMEISAENMSQ